jgi:putative membrane protein
LQHTLASAVLAAAHFLAIFTVLAVLTIEWALYVPAMQRERLELLRKIDLGYLFAALAIVATGLLRVFTSDKGTAFYTHNPVFWTKMGLFAAVGLLSVVPTAHYLRLPKDADVTIEQTPYRRVRRYIAAQLTLFALIPLAAALMARGVGL